VGNPTSLSRHDVELKSKGVRDIRRGQRFCSGVSRLRVPIGPVPGGAEKASFFRGICDCVNLSTFCLHHCPAHLVPEPKDACEEEDESRLHSIFGRF
jgi:hypothetical protein